MTDSTRKGHDPEETELCRLGTAGIIGFYMHEQDLLSCTPNCDTILSRLKLYHLGTAGGVGLLFSFSKYLNGK